MTSPSPGLTLGEDLQVLGEVGVEKLAPRGVHVPARVLFGLLDCELLSLHQLLLLLEFGHIHTLQVLNKNLLKLIRAWHHQLYVIHDLENNITGTWCLQFWLIRGTKAGSLGAGS